MTDHATVSATVEAYLRDSGHDWERGARDDEFVVSLPGEKKLKTVTSLVVSDTGVSASAFVVRNPDENHEELYRFLLRRNLRLPGLAYAVDKAGDVYVTGRLPLGGVDAASLDQLLGVVLVMGFLTSMRKEWEWRVSRGESLRNLEAFRHILERPGDPEAGA